ncbi:MAG: FAD-dependent oxidoreductase [Candidatus Vogelbacteria bacterium]|nr:FAD-dependent oxidoreductase [Candidatus Vogelbacteria bacterium]
MIYDLIIIGGGPAGVSAGVYAVRKKLKTLVVAQELAGQSSVSHEIQNWIGEPSISGIDLAKKLETHLRSYEGEDLTIKVPEKVTGLERASENFKVKTDKGEYEAKTVLITAGATRRKLTVKGADVFEQKGVTYCASCDGPMFSGQKVVVIGGGNAGFNSAAQLLAYCESVTLLEMAPAFRAEQITIDKMLENPNFKALNNIELIEIKGSKFVSSLVYKNMGSTTSTSSGQASSPQTSELVELPATGIFVEIGFVANTDTYKDIVKLNEKSEIIVDHKTQKTSQAGIWSAGDCTDVLYRQNNIAAGDAANAVEDIYNFLQKK